jgi:predicted RNA methylase
MPVVKQARWIAEQPFTPEKKFAELRWLYERQPRLGTRTSTSVRDQAYSTPVPLAYLAGKLADITHDTTVYEPTAGNGALTITADPAKTIVNELNPERRANLREQGFKEVMDHDASTETPRNQIDIDGVDRVIANPPFGPVKEEGQSKVFDLSKTEIGVPYKTHEIDHAIAIQALEAMKDDGRAALILGGVNKLVTTDKGRADAYQGKAKREFFKALYDTYGVTDHFTVNGDLYERQGAGWPVDVVIINGRKKSALPLPSVAPPRIYNTWDELGGLLNGQPATGNVRPAGAETGPAAGADTELAGARAGDRGLAGGDNAGPAQSGGVRGQPGAEAVGTGARGGEPANEPGGPRQGVERDRNGQQPAVEDFDAAFDAALDDAFGPAGSTSQHAETLPKREPAAAGPRTTAKVAKDTAKTGIKAADEAFSALTKLFGGNKLSMGVSFDEETYKQAKPHFEAAASAFSEFKSNLGELLKRMVGHLRDALKWTREAMEKVKPYLKRFIEDMRAAEEAEPERKKALNTTPTETENQVVYKPQSKVKGLDTLIPVNMAKPTFDALAKLEAKVGQIDTFVAKELGYKPEELEKYFGAEQVDALALRSTT